MIPFEHFREPCDVDLEARRRRLRHLADLLAERAAAPRDHLDRQHRDQLVELAARTLLLADSITATRSESD